MRIWNIESEKLISKVELHDYLIKFLICFKEFTFTYGYDLKICKYNFKER